MRANIPTLIARTSHSAFTLLPSESCNQTLPVGSGVCAGAAPCMANAQVVMSLAVLQGHKNDTCDCKIPTTASWRAPSGARAGLDAMLALCAQGKTRRLVSYQSLGTSICYIR